MRGGLYILYKKSGQHPVTILASILSSSIDDITEFVHIFSLPTEGID